MQWFSFKGISCESLDIEVMDYQSEILSKDKSRYITVPNRAGSIIAEDNTPDDIYVTVKCAYPYTIKSIMRQTARRIGTWLRGTGQLIFWDEPDKYRIARLYNAPELIDKGSWSEFEAIFRCQPYSVSTQALTVPLNSKQTLEGTAPNAGIISFTIPENTSPDGIEVSCGDKTLSIDIDFAAGDNISIDLALRTATRNNEQISNAFAPPYQFFTCNEGENQINAYIVIDEQTTAVNGTYTYNARWLG